MSKPIIEAKSLTKTYGSKKETGVTVGPMDFTIADGQFVVILGRSGSGKSTLLNLLTGLDMATDGDLIVANLNLSKISRSKLAKYRSQIGVIFQSYNLLGNLNTLENVMMGGLAGGRNVTREQAMNLLRQFNLEHRAYNNIKTLSGGEKQRAAICRALINNPKILFCDEPTGALDSQNEREVEKILTKLNQEQGKTIVMVTHNPEFAELADLVIRLEDGKIIEQQHRQPASSGKINL